MKPVEIVQHQVEAYNERDLKKFLGFYSPSIKIYQFHSNNADEKLLYQSLEEMEKAYGPMFEKFTELNCKIATRIEQGNFVIDHEHVSGLKPNELTKAVAIYEVIEEKIKSVWFIK